MSPPYAITKNEMVSCSIQSKIFNSLYHAISMGKFPMSFALLE